jgi:hypothetical protein
VSILKQRTGEPAHFKPASENHFFKMDGWFVWCCSIVRDDSGLYHLFFSRWPEKYGHDGWVNHSEIARAECSSLEGVFEFKDVVLGARKKGCWDSDNTHNVTVQKFGSRYYLYYTGNFGDGDYWSHRNNQRVGVAWTDHPAGPWHRPDAPMIEPRKGEWDGLMHANPVVARIPDGRYLLIFKGVANGEMPKGGNVRHGVAFADSPTGPFHLHGTPIFDLPGAEFPYEDPGLWVENGTIYCLLKTMDERYSPTGQMGTLLFRSLNGIDWEPASPHFVIGRTIEMEDGRRLSFERLERPQVFWNVDGTRVLLAAVQPVASGAVPSSRHLTGPAGLPEDTPASFNIRLFWDSAIA